ncbi:pro-neuregulin-2, membrane-bound isoform-like [Limulus polyphemus]|uniref:Pro-neuregulin-2, membrane-bound isoform-like n=1 Tax=Limulus polyphemus TaxID=6850 RepID=A0ABM1T2K3_LIMPO|nr:pro-neuregulin-2, membrane-bound isoform-like [Limulus polyphemus]
MCSLIFFHVRLVKGSLSLTMRTGFVSWLILAILLSLCWGEAVRTCLDDQLDVASKAYLAPIVFQGVLLKERYSSDSKDILFRIKRPYKTGKDTMFNKNDNVVLTFPNEYSCDNTFRIKDLQRKRKKYIIFAAPQSLAESRISGQKRIVAVASPIRMNRKSGRAVRKILCRGCAKPPSSRIRSASETVQMKEQLRLRCKVKGNPQPQIEWYRNETLLNENTRIKITTKRRSSVLTINRAKRRDSGWYRCQASNVLGPPAVSKTKIEIVRLRKPTVPLTPTTEMTHFQIEGQPCDVKFFCLNGGTCTMIVSLQERVCVCADGFKGRRCEQKDTKYMFGMFPQISSDIAATKKMLESYWGK